MGGGGGSCDEEEAAPVESVIGGGYGGGGGGCWLVEIGFVCREAFPFFFFFLGGCPSGVRGECGSGGVSFGSGVKGRSWAWW